MGFFFFFLCCCFSSGLDHRRCLHACAPLWLTALRSTRLIWPKWNKQTNKYNTIIVSIYKYNIICRHEAHLCAHAQAHREVFLACPTNMYEKVKIEDKKWLLDTAKRSREEARHGKENKEMSDKERRRRGGKIWKQGKQYWSIWKSERKVSKKQIQNERERTKCAHALTHRLNKSTRLFDKNEEKCVWLGPG